MLQSIRGLVIGLVVLEVVLAAASVVAQSPPAAQREPTAASAAAGSEGPEVPEDSRRISARAAYDRGQAAFAEGDFARALAEFSAAYRILPNPIVLRSIAKSEERMGRIADAIEHLSAFLKAVPQHPERVQVEHELSELRRRPGSLQLAISPEDAVIQIDDRPAAVRAGSTIQLSPGPHLVSVQCAGYETALREVQIVPGAPQELRLELLPAAEGEDLVMAGGAAHDDTALWIASGIGIAGLTAGSVLGFLALSENTEFDSQPTVESADRGERLALFADVAFGVAGMAAVTVAVLYLTADEPIAPERATLQWGITPLRGGGAASARIRY